MAMVDLEPNDMLPLSAPVANRGTLRRQDVFWDFCHALDEDGQREIIRALSDQALRDDVRAILCRLFLHDHLDVVIASDGSPAPDDAQRRERLFAYAQAAERLNGDAPVIDAALLQTALAGADASADTSCAAMMAARTAVIARLHAYFATAAA